MDKNQQENISAALNSILGGRKLICGLCGGTRWDIAPGYGKLTLSDNPDRVIVFGAGLVIPVVVIVCQHCGNIILMSALILQNRVPKPPEKPAEESKPSGLVFGPLSPNGLNFN